MSEGAIRYEDIRQSIESHEQMLARLRAEHGFLIDVLGDDGECAVAPGWVDKKHFRLQLYALEATEADVNTEDIEHSWGRHEAHGDEDWTVYCPPTSKGALKMTWWFL